MELWVRLEPPKSILRQNEIPGAFLATTLQFVNHVLAIRRVLPIQKTDLRKVPAFPPTVVEEGWFAIIDSEDEPLRRGELIQRLSCLP